MDIPLKIKNNPTELKLFNILYDLLRPQLDLYKYDNTVDMIKYHREVNKAKYLLFLNAETTILTRTQKSLREIEFLIVDNKNRYFWFDAKHSNTTTNITDLHGEYYQASKLKGNVYYVVDGNGYSNEVINEHKRFLKEHKIHNVHIINLENVKELFV